MSTEHQNDRFPPSGEKPVDKRNCCLAHKSLPLWGRWQPVRVVLSAAGSKSVDCRGQSHLYSTDEVRYNVTNSMHFRRKRTLYRLRRCDFGTKSHLTRPLRGHPPQRGGLGRSYTSACKQPFSSVWTSDPLRRGAEGISRCFQSVWMDSVTAPAQWPRCGNRSKSRDP